MQFLGQYHHFSAGLQVDVDWTDKSCTLTQEATFIQFNFTGTGNWTMDKLGHIIDPYNVVTNGSAFQHSKFDNLPLISQKSLHQLVSFALWVW